jgi:hypothetical protein
MCTDCAQGLRGALEHVLAQLETCARALSAYLHSKRLAFARLGFIGDGALLEVLAQAATEPNAVLGRCLPALFAATAGLELRDERSYTVCALLTDMSIVVVIAAGGARSLLRFLAPLSSLNVCSHSV